MLEHPRAVVEPGREQDDVGKCRYRDEHGKCCTNCDDYRPWTEFHEKKTARDGHASWCKRCVRAASDAHRAAKKACRLPAKPNPWMTGTKRCVRCRETKMLDDFRWVKAAGTWHSWCRPCQNGYDRVWGTAKRRLNGVFAKAKPEGFTKLDKSGYVRIKATGHHRADQAGWTWQHVLVAEEKYGIKITRAFTVHHKNGVRSDNRPENLELRVGLHGKHADVVDGILINPEFRARAAEVLAEYGYVVTPPSAAVAVA